MNEPFDPILDLTHNRAPIYVQLSTLFRRFIVSGQWAVDARVPTHEDLAAQFDVNPATIRKAIAILEEEGLVQRFRRHGTFVLAKPSSADWFDIGTRWKDAVHMYDGLVPQRLDWVEAKGVPVMFHGHGVQAQQYLFSRRTYLRGNDPFVIEEAYLARPLRRQIGDAKLKREPLLKVIDAAPNLRIGRVDETFRFGIADSEISALLEVPLNGPVVIIHLSVLDNSSILLLESTSYLRGDLVRISESIKYPRRVRRTSTSL